ncbi:FtsK/SpoIIIE domain-containing protein [uncultured Pseudokineococcus sp.]|uniref:FtsK/SpoIIIE domain-containing protein n=1 Tax=uncultured Pseudokineococcus sp. TaxID=1642928 RepID=UPI00262B2DD7|nr:FtsK/SpoIIIE domain-containing protein [uncultured Pseudokineococcus sp.]
MDHGPLRITLLDEDAPDAPSEVEVDLAGAGPGSAGPLLEDLAGELGACLDAPVVAGARGADPAAGRTWWCAGSPVPAGARLGAPPLVQGALLVRRREGAARPEARAGLPPRPPAVLHLHVVAGPDAGAVVPLPPGPHVVGRGAGADVRLEDPRLSRRHVRLDVDRRGAVVTDLGTTNGTRLDGEPLRGPGAPAGAGARVAVGSTVLELRLGGNPLRPGAWDGLGHRLVARTSRAPSGAAGARVTLPRTPEAPERPRGAWAPALVPLVVAVPMALLWSPWALLMGLASPLVAVATTAGERRAWARRCAASAARAERRRRAGREDAARAVRAEEVLLRSRAPGAADVALALATAGPRLWERRPQDPVWLSVGTGTAPSSTHVLVEDDEGGAREHVPLLHDVPLGVDLTGAGAVGVVGPPDAVRATARWLVLQVAALHAPSDVGVAVLAGTGGGRRAPWSWAGWLPSAGPGAVAAGRSARELAVARLLELADGAGEPRDRTERATSPGRTLVLVDDDDEVRATPGLVRLLREGPGSGVLAVCLGRAPEALPDGCGALVELGGEGRTQVRVTSGAGHPLRGSATGVSAATAARTARAAAPLREAQAPGAGPGRDLPDRVVLGELLGPAGAPDPAAVVATWRRTSRDGGSVAVPVGRGPDGPRLLDLVADGPHALVAGTTGSGKSELLRTLVTSLALHHAPEDLSFVLVDYKGGAAFAGVAELPHVSGLVTDLDHHLTARALRSLGAEVARRERLLRAAGAEDLRAYRERRRPGDPVLGRLVLVVDEFRVLAEELPDFVDGLVRLAAVGRSLGLHLVLATQRPAGVVGPDVAANVNLRIALRVRDEHDSLDVVEARDAARLSPGVPGRSLWRVGGGALEEVQVASTGPAPTRGPRVRGARPHLDEHGQPGRGRDLPRAEGPPTAAPPAPPAGDAGDLGRLVATVRDAWRGSRAPLPPRPWLPPLPPVVALPARGAPEERPSSPGPVLRWGLVDDPDGQAQRPLGWDLSRRTHLLVVGGPRSGRTGAARALVAAAAGQTTPEEVVVHVVDPAGELADAAGLAAVASVVAHDDDEHAARVLEHLVGLVDARRERARLRGAPEDPSTPPPAGGDAAATTGEPVVLLVVDGWEVVSSAWEEVRGGACLDLLHRLLREGPGAGVLVAMTADPRVLGGRTGAAFGDRVVLALADPVDAVLAGLPARAAPAPGAPPGRGVLVRAGAEATVAAAGRGTSTGPLEVQVAAVEALGALGPVVTAGDDRPVRAARRLPPMPRRVLDDHLPAPVGELLLGVGGTHVEAVGLRADLDGPVCSVLGHPGSGRSTALAVLERSAALRGWSSVLLRAGAAAAWAGEPPAPTARRVAADAGDAAALLQEALGARDRGRPLLLLVDDADLLEASAVAEVLSRAAEGLVPGTGDAAGAARPDRDPRLRPGDLLVLAASTPVAVTRSSGLLATGRRTRSGVLLGPSGPLDGEALGLPLRHRGGGPPPGRGLLVRRARATPLQVALPGSGPHRRRPASPEPVVARP